MPESHYPRCSARQPAGSRFGLVSSNKSVGWVEEVAIGDYFLLAGASKGCNDACESVVVITLKTSGRRPIVTAVYRQLTVTESLRGY
jgi:hypothetical protein